MLSRQEFDANLAAFKAVLASELNLDPNQSEVIRLIGVLFSDIRDGQETIIGEQANLRKLIEPLQDPTTFLDAIARVDLDKYAERNSPLFERAALVLWSYLMR